MVYMASRLCFLLLVIFCSSYASLVSNRKDAVENKRLSLPLDFLLRNQSRRASFSGICSNNGPVKMGSKNGYRLSILDDGTVEGVHDSDGSQNELLERTTLDSGIIAIRGIRSKRYLAIDANGDTVTTGELGIENYFLENMASNWNTYKSHAYQQKGWYLGLNKRGKPIKNVDLKRRAAIYFQVDCTRN